MPKIFDILDLIFVTIVRGLFMGCGVFLALACEFLGRIPSPIGLIIAIMFAVAYIYSVIDEVILTFKDVKK